MRSKKKSSFLAVDVSVSTCEMQIISLGARGDLLPGPRFYRSAFREACPALSGVVDSYTHCPARIYIDKVECYRSFAFDR